MMKKVSSRVGVLFLSFFISVPQAEQLISVSSSPDVIETTEVPQDSPPDERDELDSDSIEALDPLEPVNRIFFAFNQVLDGLIFRPVSLVYRAVLPEPVRDGIAHCISNLLTPVTFVNQVLQGHPDKAGISLLRFCVNSTLGIAGFVDIADYYELSPVDTGLDDTLTLWGLDTGPYLVIPVFGPNTVRSSIGIVGDYYADPINYYYTHKGQDDKWVLYTEFGFWFVDKRHRVTDMLDQLQKDSLDFYATMRSIHFQQAEYKRTKLMRKKEQV